MAIAILAAFYVLANFGERSGSVRAAAIVADAFVAGFALFFGVRVALDPAQFLTNETTAIAIIVAAVLGFIYLLPPAQRAVAHIIPVRPSSPVDSLTVILGLQLVAQQLVSQVRPAPQPVTIGEMLAQDIPLVILAFIGVGLFVRRSPRQAAQRLGWVAPRSKRWWLVAVLGIFVFLAVAAGIEQLANKLSPSSQQQVTHATNVLFSHFNNPLGVILLGVMPGVMEETLFRGALLPRLGIVVTSVLFAALHSQYALTFATLEVFILGIGLGWLRVRSGSTLPCIVTHAGYNIAVGVLASLSR